MRMINRMPDNETKTYRYIVRMFLGGVLLLSAGSHIENPPSFLETIFRYRVFNASISLWLATYLPFFQTLIGCYLILGIGSKFVRISTIGLFTCFFAIQFSAWIRGLKIDCGCFGPHEQSEIDLKSVLLVGVLMITTFFAFSFVYEKEPTK
jgi:hypothetical protein